MHKKMRGREFERKEYVDEVNYCLERMTDSQKVAFSINWPNWKEARPVHRKHILASAKVIASDIGRAVGVRR